MRHSYSDTTTVNWANSRFDARNLEGINPLEFVYAAHELAKKLYRYLFSGDTFQLGLQDCLPIKLIRGWTGMETVVLTYHDQNRDHVHVVTRTPFEAIRSILTSRDWSVIAVLSEIDQQVIPTPEALALTCGHPSSFFVFVEQRQNMGK